MRGRLRVEEGQPAAPGEHEGPGTLSFEAWTRSGPSGVCWPARCGWLKLGHFLERGGAKTRGPEAPLSLQASHTHSLPPASPARPSAAIIRPNLSTFSHFIDGETEMGAQA